MNTERNCQACNYYKDGYCENLELKPCYPQKGCDDFENKDLDVLDKIRAEIEQLHLIGYAIIDGKREIAKRAVIQVLDKYKAESEEVNGNDD